MKLLKGNEEITKAITSIQTRGKKLDKDIHVAGCSCLQHIEEHGDVTLLNRLISAMPKGSRVNALREWANSFGKVVFNDDSKEFDYSKKKVTLIEDAIAKSWTDFKPEPVYKTQDFDLEMQAILKKAYARVGKDKGDKINPETLAQVAKAFGFKKEEV